MPMQDDIADRLCEDLIGPFDQDEFIEGGANRPSDRYLTGILWPLGQRMRPEEDDGQEVEAEEDDGARPSSPPLAGQPRPCSMGLSFATEGSSDKHEVNVVVRFATYRYVKAEPEGPLEGWQRVQHHFERTLTLPSTDAGTRDITLINGADDELELTVVLHLRGSRFRGRTVATITLINQSEPGEDRIASEVRTLFQTEIAVRGSASTQIVPRPDDRQALDEDGRIADLLYRDCREIAVGHQCSVEWRTAESTIELVTHWIPRSVVGAFRQDGHEVFQAAVNDGVFDARSLANDDAEHLLDRLRVLPDAYSKWIAIQEARVAALEPHFQATASDNLVRCRSVLNRIRAGIEALRTDETMRRAFQLANEAMAIQYGWRAGPRASLRWRPFQIGFILLAAQSACDGDSPDRMVLDLLWFPTGGGKTEAYLALIAMVAMHRRLSTPSVPDGNVALMRYTLRLLTAQQFERATALILACELIRRGHRDTLGETPFSIGLWLGEKATPNDFKQALREAGQQGGATAEQLLMCPCCKGPLEWNYDEGAESVTPYCTSRDCPLGQAFGQWPVYTVDSDIYRSRPTLLIGTVDKFAMLPIRAEVATLFGLGQHRSPKTSLIIQDELHLISGPLGTIVGLYETALDWLLRDARGRRPKIIGSTATIRRASDQARALFDRTSCQFPPPGLDYGDSGFAVLDPAAPGRLHLAVTTAGRSAKFCLQAVAASLLQSGSEANEPEAKLRDGYATLLCYFNALRELGGAIVLMLDDVQRSIEMLAQRRGEQPRQLRPPLELSSNASQQDIVQAIAALALPADDPDCVDTVLATNMVSVGVDVPRLGLMLVNGQPKSRSEYIQATSRVGRASFPGAVVSVLNAGKPRDRSHYESFLTWHRALYRGVEATSVTPFAPRARERALHAALVAMIRHGTANANLQGNPGAIAGDPGIQQAVREELVRRIAAIDNPEAADAADEIGRLLGQWAANLPQLYWNPYVNYGPLLQPADKAAHAEALGMLPGAGWPTMTSMRSVEPSTQFKVADRLPPQ
jgi:hypothetical protein